MDFSSRGDIMKSVIQMDIHILSVLLVAFIGGVMASAPTATTNVKDNILVIPEDAPINSTLYTITITDSDVNDKAQINASDGDASDMVWLDYEPNTTLPQIVQVNVKKLFDRDPPCPSLYTLKFKISDITHNVVYSTVNVYPQDVNDNAPNFNAVQYTWALHENAALGTNFIGIIATDRDNGNNGTFSYKMSPTSQSTSVAAEYNSTFEIDPALGHVTLTKLLDYEKNSFYQFSVVAKDNGKPAQSSSVVLVIKVLDVQDTPPFFTGIPYRTDFIESNKTHVPVLTLTAVDGDHGIPNAVEYNITGGPCSDMFSIDKNGAITSCKPIDRDAGVVKAQGDICQLIIQASEKDDHPNDQYGNTTTSTTVTITVLDVNDNSPTFNETNLTTQVQENLSPGSTIVVPNLSVSDLDMGINAIMSLYITDTKQTSITDFEVQPNSVFGSGTLTILVKNNTLLDKEMRNSTVFLVIAQEAANQSHNATATVTLEILDMNDNSPVFVNTSYALTVNESSVNGTVIGIITATDKDSGKYGEISYNITGAGGRFIVDTNTGEILVNCSNCTDELDRERIDMFYLALTATDNGGKSTLVPVTIQLNDINDNTPIFSRSVYEGFIDEDKSYPYILQVEAHDSDKGANAEIQYKILGVYGGYDPINLNISNNTGTLSLNGPIDYEKLKSGNGSVIVQVRAEDKGQPPQYAVVNVTLRVQDLNDNPPTFSKTQYNGRILENKTSPAEVNVNITINATDCDGTDRNSQFRYFITAGSFDKFIINASTGIVALQVGEKLDRDNRPAYNLTIEAIDQGYPPLTGTATLSVDIVDVNNKFPKFDPEEYTRNILEENAYNGIVVVNATDTDGDSNLVYTIINCYATSEDERSVNETLIEGYFNIEKSTGTISATNRTDRETASQIVLTILVEDTKAFNPKPQTATAKVTITLLDVNDNNPVFVVDNYTVQVPENAVNGPIIETIQATDADQNRTITYTIKEKNIPFAVVNSTGALKKSGIIDHETNKSISFTVVATDNGVPTRSSTVTVTVIVLDFNDNAPIFNNMSYETHLPENATKTTSVLTVVATDKDEGPNSNIIYKLEKDVKDFNISEASGVIMVNSVLDRETKAVYNFAVIACDNPTDTTLQKCTQVDVTINLDDVNDNHPVFKPNTYAINIREDIVVGTTTLIVTATDKDEDKNLTYTLERDSETNFFAVKTLHNLGEIIVNASLRSYSDAYTLVITATDSGGLMNSSIVNITVDDVNLNAPVVTNIPKNNTINVYECCPVGTIFYNFTYTDSDKSNINKLSNFTMDRIQSTDTVLDVFYLNANGSLGTKRTLDATSDSIFRFQVSAVNTGSPRLTSNKTTIEIHVIDIDDHDPCFTEQERNFTVDEELPTGHVLGHLVAIDLDHDSKQCYKIVGDTNSNVEINKNGEIVTKKPLDREQEHAFWFIARVEDCPGGLHAIDYCQNTPRTTCALSTQNISVSILDINDNPPAFQIQEISIGIRRNTQLGTILPISLKDGGYVQDKDTNANGQDVWKFSNFGNIKPGPGLSDHDKGIHECEDTKKHVFCVWSNGTVIINTYFNKDISGFFEVPIMVQDKAGNSTSTLKVFLIADFQVLKMTLGGDIAEVSARHDTILKVYSDITGHQFVFDRLENHKTSDGTVQVYMTDLYFHVVDLETNRILSKSEAQSLVDNYASDLQSARYAYHVESIGASETVSQVESPDKTIYIMVAVICSLAATNVSIIYVALALRSSYKRKLKAATITAHSAKDIGKKEMQVHIPGSNMYSRTSNPLLNVDVPVEMDTLDAVSVSSNNSLDSNDVDVSSLRAMEYDRTEEREVTMDMFSEDMPNTRGGESPLDAALRFHDIQLANLRKDNETAHRNNFVNFAFAEEMETTEI